MICLENIVTETGTEPITEYTTNIADVAVETIQEQVDKATGVFSGMTQYFANILPSFITAVIVLILGILLSKFIARMSMKAFEKSNVNNATKSFFVSLIRILLYIIVIVMSLSIMNVPTSSIITILGTAGLAVSLALQNCLSNLCGGFIILFSKPFVAGDIIELDGTVGKVQSISILYTKIVTFDNKTVFIPNGKVSDAKIINYTESPTRRIDLSFDISYSSDYQKARQLILDIVKNEKLILDKPESTVRMSSHGESSVTIDTLVWVKNDDYFPARYNLIEAVKSAFDENGIEIPYNQLDVHVKAGEGSK